MRLRLLVACFVLAAPATASADHDGVPVPPGAPVVAGPTPAGATLVAFGHRGEVCIALRTAGGESSAECTVPPSRPSQAANDYGFLEDSGPAGLGAHGGVVHGDVKRVELRFAVRRGRVPRDSGQVVATTPGDAYRGPGAGRVRFYLAEGPADTPWLTRYADEAGSTLAADGGFDAPVLGTPVTIARARGGVSLRAVRRPQLAATPLDRGRLVEQTCVEIQVPREQGGGVCSTADRPFEGDLDLDVRSPCERLYAPVVVSRRVRRVEAVLGDGRRQPIRLFDVRGPRRPQVRAGALVVRGAVALRRVEAFGADGRVVERRDVRRAPPAPCGDDGSSVSGFLYYTEGSTREPRGPLAFRVRDDGARICAALGDLDPAGSDCGLPPVQPELSNVGVRRADGRTLVAGVLPPDVAFVEVIVDGAARRLETVPDVPGYGGQYAGASRFLVLELPGAPRLGAVRFLDAGGVELSRAPALDFEEPRPRATRIVAVAGLRLRVSDFAGQPGLLDPFACVGPAARPADECQALSPQFVAVEALCSPRRLLIVGQAPAGTRSVTVRTTSGVGPARLLRIGGSRVAVAVLPPFARPVGITFRGRSVRNAPIALPPAARQCGYDATAVFSDRRR